MKDDCGPSLEIHHPNQEVTVDFDFVGHVTSYLEVARGHLHSKVKDVKFDCEMGFDTQEFPIAFGELVPAVNFDVKNFTVDGKDSTLKITGFIIDFFENILANIFREKFMDVLAT